MGEYKLGPMARLSQAWRQILKGSQDVVLGPWLTCIVKELKLDVKLGEKKNVMREKLCSP